jgi:hypothetical protein
MSIYYVYQWLREDLTPYYIGKGSGKRRFVSSHRYVKPPKDPSLNRIIAQNLPEDTAFAVERFMIRVHGRKDLGTGILLNFTDGGEGVSGYVPTPEVREQISNTLKSKNITRSDETKKKISISQTGKKRDDAARAKISAAGIGRPQSEETKLRKSLGLKGRKQSPEHIANAKAARQRNKLLKLNAHASM